MDAVNGIKTARRATLSVFIGGHDAANYVDPHLLDFSFTDNAGGKADEVQITLHDRDGKWNGEWRPQKGTAVFASITVHDWEGEGHTATLPCGTFKVDEIEFSGPPDKVKLKAVTSALTSGLRDEDKTRAWENFSLGGLAGQIATENGLDLMYDGPEHSFARQDQREESDLAFLQRLSSERGMNCKVHDGKLVMFDAAGADAKAAALTISKTGSMYSPSSYSFKESSSKTGYKNAKVAYTDPTTGTTHTAQVQAADAEADEKTLQLNQRVESAGDAMRMGKGELRNKNKEKNKASLEFMGNPAVVAGVVLALTGFGQFDGRWFVEKAEHKIGSGYTTSIEIRKTLDY